MIFFQNYLLIFIFRSPKKKLDRGLHSYSQSKAKDFGSVCDLLDCQKSNVTNLPRSSTSGCMQFTHLTHSHSQRFSNFTVTKKLRLFFNFPTKKKASKNIFFNVGKRCIHIYYVVNVNVFLYIGVSPLFTKRMCKRN